MGLLDAGRKKAQTRQAKPAGALAGLKAKRVEPVPKGALAGLGKKNSKPALAMLGVKPSPLDFSINGVRYCNAKIMGDRGRDSVWGTIDAINGRQRFRFHNRFGSWMHDVPGKEGYMREPAALGIGSQMEVCTALRRRLDAEIKAQSYQTEGQKEAERVAQEEAKAARKRKRVLAMKKAKKK